MNPTVLPKAFLIHATCSGSGKSGFLRNISYVDENGNISYKTTIVQRKSDASRFLNYDLVKERAIGYSVKLGLENVKIIDNSSGKTSNVKEPKS